MTSQNKINDDHLAATKTLVLLVDGTITRQRAIERLGVLCQEVLDVLPCSAHGAQLRNDVMAWKKENPETEVVELTMSQLVDIAKNWYSDQGDTVTDVEYVDTYVTSGVMAKLTLLKD